MIEIKNSTPESEKDNNELNEASMIARIEEFLSN